MRGCLCSWPEGPESPHPTAIKMQQVPSDHPAVIPTAPGKFQPSSLAGLFVILLLVIVGAWPGMQSALFADDVHQLDKSSHFVRWTEVFQPDVFGFYRPVKNAIFMVCAPLAKNHIAWHWVGLAAYLAATLGIFRIVRICLGSARPALLAAAVWALSPTGVSTVLWMSCANISLGLVFAACVFHFHERGVLRPSLVSLAACGIFFGLSLLCYEAMIAIPALLFLRDLQQKRLAFDRGTIMRYALYTAVALAFFIVRHQCSARSIGDNEFHPGFAPDIQGWQLSLSAPWFLWRHFLMWIFPFGNLELLGSYGWLRSASVASLVFGWVFLAGMLVAAAMTWKRLPAVSYGLLFFVLASMPAGNFLPGFNGPINDAYVTIPSIGLAIAFAALCELLIRQFLKCRRESDPGMILALLMLGFLLVYRIPVCGAYFRYWAQVWQDPVKLVLLSSETRPFQFQAKAYASVLLFNEGYLDQSETLAHEAITDAPWNPLAKLTLAKSADFRKDYAAAETYYRSILSTPDLEPVLKDPTLLDLAEMLSHLPARREEAAQICREMLKNTQSPRHSGAVILLAIIYREQGNPAKARATLERGLSMHPRDEKLQQALQAAEHPAPVKNPAGQ